MSALNLENFQSFQRQGYTILDVRDSVVFGPAFIPGSINIQYDRNFNEIANELLIKNQPMLLIAESGREKDILAGLTSKGYSKMIGYLEGGIKTWLQAANPIDVIISINSEEFALELKHGDLYLIDIRPQEEFDIQHVDKSINFEQEILINNYDALDDMITNCIYCLDGSLSMSIISYLKFNGKHNLYHLQGGFISLKNQDGIKLLATEKKFEKK